MKKPLIGDMISKFVRRDHISTPQVLSEDSIIAGDCDLGQNSREPQVHRFQPRSEKPLLACRKRIAAQKHILCKRDVGSKVPRQLGLRYAYRLHTVDL